MQEEKNKYGIIINHLLHFLYSDVENNPEQVKDILSENDYNYDELVEDGLKFIGDIERKQRTVLAREKRKRMIEALVNFSKETGHETKETLFKKLKELAAGDEQLQLAFHKLESLSEDDLRNILNDVEALRMLGTKDEQSEIHDDKPDA